MKVKGKNVVRFLLLVIVILFFSLYFSMASGYFEYNEGKKTTLTEEAIERFDNDVAEGKEISADNYLEKEVNYSNRFSKVGMKLSTYIEKGFNKMMNAFFREIEKTVNSEG